MATNIAETSLTVPGVSLVVDGGWQKVARYDAERAIDTLVLERVTADGAAQRAGRAARLGPGRAWRLWDARDRLRPAREPEVDRVDLAGVVLGLMAAGNAPERFRWFESPRRSACRPPGNCWSASARSKGRASPRSAINCAGCRCIRVSRAC